MAQAAHRECSWPCCPNYAVGGRYCLIHKAARNRAPVIQGDRLKPNNWRFMALRRSFLVRHPVCNACRHEPATELDHIVPHRGVARLFWDQANWQGLCAGCHGRKTALEVWGRGGPDSRGGPAIFSHPPRDFDPPTTDGGDPHFDRRGG
jgi:5-methylcytosine-specific restriction protein A